MEEYMTKTREDYGTGISRPKINEKAHFELKGQFLKELCDNTFSGSDNEDANKHIEKVLEILIGSAIQWLRNEPTGSIDTWETLKKKFLSKYCLPTQRTIIEMPSTLLDGYALFYKGLDVPIRQILDSKGIILL
ncbi:hypothetical protein Tco_0192281 [Tanacetum coccineum]